MKEVFKGKYLKYSPEITLEVFTLVWGKLIDLGYVHYADYPISKAYAEFKGDYNYLRTTSDYSNAFNCYDNKGNYTYARTTVEEILGYNPFKEETTTAKDWNEATEEELLEEAIRRYPIGCKIKLIGSNIGGNFKNEVRFTKYRFFNTISKRKQLYVDNNLLLFDGVWAEIESLPEIESKIENKEAFDAQNKSKLIEKCCCSFQIGQTVYHRNVYEYKVPLKIVGILDDKLLLEGDFSGGTHNVIQREWLPVKGTSRIYNHDFKLNARKAAIDIETLITQYTESLDNNFKSMRDIAHAATVLANTIMTLTNDVSLNSECE